MLPVAATALDGCDGVDNAEGQDALDGTGYQSKGEGVRVVLIPGLYVEGQEGCEVLAECALIEIRSDYEQPKSTSTVFQPWPKFMAAENRRVSKLVLSASTPWSKSSPSGPDCPVRRLK